MDQATMGATTMAAARRRTVMSRNIPPETFSVAQEYHEISRLKRVVRSGGLTGFLTIPVLLGTACTATRPAPAETPSVSAEAPPATPDDSREVPSVLDAVLWMQTSAEYVGLARQTWALALDQLRRNLADTSYSAVVEQRPGAGSLPAAVIVDVDETVLDNSPYAARLIEDGEEFSEATWGAWVNEARARPVPGALEFVRAAVEMGVTVFYVTNRNAELEEGTARNLAAQGFPASAATDLYLLKDERPEWGSDKTTRRAFVARDYRVVLVAGDDLNDFVSGARGAGVAERFDLARRYGERWGRGWFVLPNPTYGSWESAILLEAPRDDRDAVLRAKYDALEGARD